jgi:hypothetical protein
LTGKSGKQIRQANQCHIADRYGVSRLIAAQDGPRSASVQKTQDFTEHLTVLCLNFPDRGQLTPVRHQELGVLIHDFLDLQHGVRDHKEIFLSTLDAL